MVTRAFDGGVAERATGAGSLCSAMRSDRPTSK